MDFRWLKIIIKRLGRLHSDVVICFFFFCNRSVAAGLRKNKKACSLITNFRSSCIQMQSRFIFGWTRRKMIERFRRRTQSGKYIYFQHFRPLKKQVEYIEFVYKMLYLVYQIASIILTLACKLISCEQILVHVLSIQITSHWRLEKISR